MEVHRLPYTRMAYPSVDMGIITYVLWDMDEVVDTNTITHNMVKYAANPLIPEPEVHG